MAKSISLLNKFCNFNRLMENVIHLLRKTLAETRVLLGTLCIILVSGSFVLSVGCVQTIYSHVLEENNFSSQPLLSVYLFVCFAGIWSLCWTYNLEFMCDCLNVCCLLSHRNWRCCSFCDRLFLWASLYHKIRTYMQSGYSFVQWIFYNSQIFRSIAVECTLK